MPDRAGQALLSPARRTHFKISEVAQCFQVTVQTVHFWLRTGRIRRSSRTSVKGTHLIPRGEFVRILEEAGREVPGLWERSRTKVLVIDDDRGIRELATHVARSRRMPLHLKVAETIEDGLLLAAQFGPEVIFLDTSFPKDKLRGDQGLAFIRGTKLLRKVRVVALVNNAKTGEGMLRGGADAFLLKPFTLEEFRGAVTVPSKDRELAGR